MMDEVRDLHGTIVLVYSEDGPLLSSERDAGSFLCAAWERNATLGYRNFFTPGHNDVIAGFRSCAL